MNSGVADCVAGFIIGLSDDYGPHVLLAILFVITNLFYGTDHEQCGCGSGIPVGTVHLGAVERKSDTFLCRDLVWLRLPAFPHRSVIRLI